MGRSQTSGNFRVAARRQPGQPGSTCSLRRMTTPRSTKATSANMAAIAGNAAGASKTQRATAPVAQTTSQNVASAIRSVSALCAGAAPPIPENGSW